MMGFPPSDSQRRASPGAGAAVGDFLVSTPASKAQRTWCVAREVLASEHFAETQRMLGGGAGFSSADDFIYYKCPQFQIYLPLHQKCITLEASEN